MSVVVVELYEALRKAGVGDALARDAAAAVVPADALSQLATKDDISRLELATKADISRLELATRDDIARLELTTKHDIARLEHATARDISRLEGQISELKAELIKWNVGAIAIMTAIFAAIARLT